MTVREWLGVAKVDGGRIIVSVNGDYWLRAQWDQLIPHGAIVGVAPVAEGGGGSNPLSFVLQLAVMAAAIYVPGAQGLLGLGLKAGTFAFAAATAGIAVGGALLVNALVPAARVNPSITGVTTSPTYGLQSSSNMARLLDAMPVVYGRMKVKPDLASAPYTEFSGNDQYLYQLFCITQGEIEIESVLIGDTPIANFSEIDYEIVGPNRPVTLFPDNVVTSTEVSGIELQAPNDGGDWIGPFVASPAGSSANFIGVDLTLPTGLFYANDDGSLGSLALTYTAQARKIDDSGNATSDWLTLDTREFRMSTAQPQQMSYRYGVDAGRYEVRLKRTTNLNTDSRAQNRIDWAGLRAYLPSERYYGDCTLLAMRARATNNLNSNSARDLNVVGTRKLPVWNGTAWSSPQPCRSIAWAIADACRNTTYGAGLPDRRIDLNVLLALDAVWTARGDQFNGVFDTKGTFWDALTTICAAGRAVPMYLGGQVSVVRDEIKTVRTAVFTPDNMTPGSLSIQYSFYSADTPDCVDLQYYDEETWQWKDVLCVPEGAPGLNPSTIKMVGVTNRAQAWREGIYRAYANRDQRKQISLTTELEGLIPEYGDLIGVSHDMPKWGISGTVDGMLRDDIVMVDQELEWAEGAQHYVCYTMPNGRPTAALRVRRPGDDVDGMSMQLVDELPDDFEFSDGFEMEPTRFSFGPSSTQMMQDCRLISIKPNDDGKVELVMVNAADSPHLAETTQHPPPPVSPSLLPGIIHAPIIAQLTADAQVVPGSVVLAASTARGAVTYEFQGSANAGQSWQALGTSSANSWTAAIAIGDWIFRVRAFGESGLAGPWTQWSGTVEKFVYPPAPPALSLREPFTGSQLSVEIQRLPEIDYFHVQVVVGGVVKYEVDITAQNFTWSLEQARQAGAVAPSFDIRVAGGNIAGLGNYAILTVVSMPPDSPTASFAPGSGSNGTLSWASTGTIHAASYVVRQGGSVIYAGTNTSRVVAGNLQYAVASVGDWGSESTPTLVDTPLTDPPDTGGGGA
ncbi:host specificity factor TipJ family phage tail protein [Burkholderia anthina]|uniref:host specificity factor TipJ family phage tail protein n=1 Tax=Burkholderia anthina TaxID=179879 RepID=UPI001AA04AD9|nr:host specificity factor TipJ family phage tail protein [Burkholderia anthina]QTD91753.1 phage tail protein [Burkholderia anthina]